MFKLLLMILSVEHFNRENSIRICNNDVASSQMGT